MNPNLLQLHDYPFQKLARLTHGIESPASKTHIALSLGEPQHAAPDFVPDTITANLPGLTTYPNTKGALPLRRAIADWANRRYQLEQHPLDPERHILPTCGSREALFSIAQAVVDKSAPRRPVVMMPNPFYQIYEGAALLAGAEPWYLNTVESNGYAPDLDNVPVAVWERTQLLYLCSPANPTGAVLDSDQLQQILELAERFDFVIAADECYSEIYFAEDQPPAGLLQVADTLGAKDHQRCLVFQSLSKRSNLPGLRSGFVAGDGEIMRRYLQYRTYHGCTVPTLTQAVSIAAWRDENHVRANRDQYRAKFSAVLEILAPLLRVQHPAAGFYLWPETPIDEERFCRELLAQQNVKVLPGSYLSRKADGVDPGKRRVRIALVAELDECIEAANRIRQFIGTL